MSRVRAWIIIKKKKKISTLWLNNIYKFDPTDQNTVVCEDLYSGICLWFLTNKYAWRSLDPVKVPKKLGIFWFYLFKKYRKVDTYKNCSYIKFAAMC